MCPYSTQNNRQGCCRECKPSQTPVLKEQERNPTTRHNCMAGDSDSGTVYLGMNGIIDPCPAQFLEVPSHAARVFRVLMNQP